MLVSVIVCTYSPTMIDHCLECINSIIDQTYDDLEIVCIVDGNREYYDMLKDEIPDGIKLFLNERNLGLLESRNRGVRFSKGEIVAFIDDDAIADKRWVEEFVKIYEGYDALAVGGKLEPLWLTKKPKWFPEEFYWLIGVTYLGFPTELTEVRNTFGSNLSFRKKVFLELGGFNSAMGGIKGKSMMQGGETELCMRLRRRFGRGVIYNPNAVVYHKIFERRTKIGFLIKRAFWQGYSKAIMGRLSESYDGAMKVEKDYFKNLLNIYKKRIKSTIKGSVYESVKVGVSLLLTLSVLFGYISGGIGYGRLCDND